MKKAGDFSQTDQSLGGNLNFGKQSVAQVSPHLASGESGTERKQEHATARDGGWG